MKTDIAQYLVNKNGSLRDAMVAVHRGAVEICLVMDDDRVIGVMTDGDIRRALLNGDVIDAPLEPHMSGDFISVGTDVGRAEVLDIMRARRIHQIPILDKERCLFGMHLMSELIGAIERPNWAVIMAGGRGERLRPLTDSIPKPMLSVAGRPILERIVLHLVGFGIRTIYISINYLGERIENHFGDGSDFGCNIQYIREEKPLGTGGALSLLPHIPENPILIMNGDIISQFDVGRILRFHQSKGNVATMGVHEYFHTVPFGVATVDETRVLDLVEKPITKWLTNAGVYVINPSLIGRIPKDTASTMPILLKQCLDKNELVGAFSIKGDWIDVGRHQELKRARGEE